MHHQMDQHDCPVVPKRSDREPADQPNDDRRAGGGDGTAHPASTSGGCRIVFRFVAPGLQRQLSSGVAEEAISDEINSGCER